MLVPEISGSIVLLTATMLTSAFTNVGVASVTLMLIDGAHVSTMFILMLRTVDVGRFDVGAGADFRSDVGVDVLMPMPTLTQQLLVAFGGTQESRGQVNGEQREQTKTETASVGAYSSTISSGLQVGYVRIGYRLTKNRYFVYTSFRASDKSISPGIPRVFRADTGLDESYRTRLSFDIQHYSQRRYPGGPPVPNPVASVGARGILRYLQAPECKYLVVSVILG